MAKEILSQQMEIYIQVIGLMIKEMEWDNNSCRMETHMKVAGKTINKMVWENM
jgi:hypothetical protein